MVTGQGQGRHHAGTDVLGPDLAAGWNGLYRVGAAAALVAAIVFRRNLGSEYVLLRSMGLFSSGPMVAPAAAADWFALFGDSPFLGLVLMNVFDVVNYALVGLIYLALCGALRRVNPGAMALAAAMGLVGVTVYFASNRAIAMLTLSRRYAAATTEALRAASLAAGEAQLAVSNPGDMYAGAGDYLALFLVTMAGLIIAVAMRRSEAFRGATAWTGILAHATMLCLFPAVLAAPGIAFLPPSLSALFLLAWYVLCGVRLLRLGREGDRMPA